MSEILNDKASQPSSDLAQKINRVKRLAWIIWSVAMIAQLFNMFHRLAVPAAIDREIAALKLASMGVAIDKLTPAQKKYLEDWKEGT